MFYLFAQIGSTSRATYSENVRCKIREICSNRLLQLENDHKGHFFQDSMLAMSDLFLVHRHEGGHDVDGHWEDDGAVVLR